MTAQSPDELFDIVDDMDRVVGQATRSEVHQKGLWHRAVHIVVRNKAGEVLLQQRSMLKDTCPGLWTTSCAGHLDAGEGYLAAAVRELQEELGIGVQAECLSKLGKKPPSALTGGEWIEIYALQHEGPFTFPEAEVAQLRWVSPETLAPWLQERPADFAGSFRFIWECYFAAH